MTKRGRARPASSDTPDAKDVLGGGGEEATGRTQGGESAAEPSASAHARDREESTPDYRTLVGDEGKGGTGKEGKGQGGDAKDGADYWKHETMELRARLAQLDPYAGAIAIFRDNPDIVEAAEAMYLRKQGGEQVRKTVDDDDFLGGGEEPPPRSGQAPAQRRGTQQPADTNKGGDSEAMKVAAKRLEAFNAELATHGMPDTDIDRWTKFFFNPQDVDISDVYAMWRAWEGRRNGDESDGAERKGTRDEARPPVRRRTSSASGLPPSVVNAPGGATDRPDGNVRRIHGPSEMVLPSGDANTL